jgi:hypothetical protein
MPSSLTGPLREPLRTHARADTWFRLRAPSDVPGQVIELARRELELAAEGLWVTPGPALDAGILYARSAVEKVRVLLRLSRGGMPEKARKKLNRRLKRLSRRLSDARDTGTLEDVVERLRQGTREPTLRDGFMVLGGRLAERRYRERGDRRDSPALSKIREGIESVRDAAPGWDFDGDGFAFLADGVESTYRRATRALDRARKKKITPKRERRLAARLRELGYALRLLEPLWPAPLAAIGHEVDRASGRLQEATELEILMAMLADDEALGSGLPASEMHERMARLKDHFRAEAVGGAARLLTASPARACAHLSDWWTAWASETVAHAEN